MERADLRRAIKPVDDLKRLIDQALLASGAAGEDLVGCHLQIARDILEEPKRDHAQVLGMQ